MKKLISTVIKEAYRVKPCEHAAYELYSLGFSEEDILACGSPYEQRIEVCNIIRDIHNKHKEVNHG